MKQAFTGARVFDGQDLAEAVLLTDGARITGFADGVPPGYAEVRLDGGILVPGLLDLQVNGGGGRMVDGTTTMQDLAALCAVHARMGATGILPTLITDRPLATAQVLAAGIAAATVRVPGFLGLHLEGPHLDRTRAGAHDPALIRPMQQRDLTALCAAARHLPALMVTLAPSAVTPDQIATLAGAGVIVSLGHSDCTDAEAQAAFAAGARCTTHLFNAMSQMGHRAPGLVGATLAGNGWAGLIADGHHVAASALRVALQAAPGRVFLVSDCMAVAGTDAAGFNLGGRAIHRRDGRLELEDGTLAGADLTLPQALAHVVRLGVPVEHALAMATRIPAAVLGRRDLGCLAPGARADLVHLSDAMDLRGVWLAGEAVAGGA